MLPADRRPSGLVAAAAVSPLLHLLLPLLQLTCARASHNPDAASIAPDAWASSYYEPDLDTFQYTAEIYPSFSVYSAGQYVRVRLSVSGKLSDGRDLSTQAGQWQWLNTSADQAGVMLIKHFIGGVESNGLNWCNATADADVLRYETDLSSASGTEPLDTPASWSVDPAATECGANDTACVYDPDGQALDAFATFELPPSYTGFFRLCYRKSSSAFTNDTAEDGWFGAYKSSVADAAAGGAWGVLHSSQRFAWQEPYGDAQLYNLTAIPDFYFEVPDGASRVSGSVVLSEGEHAVLRVKQTARSEVDGVVYLTAADDPLVSDQLKLVPKGSACVREVRTGVGLYHGTALSDDAGDWSADASEAGYAALSYPPAAALAPVLVNGTLSSRLGYWSNATNVAVGLEVNPHAATFATVSGSTLGVDMFHTLAYTVVQMGQWEVCYSSRADRVAGAAVYGSAVTGKTVLSAKRQSPGGWRKLPLSSYGDATAMWGSIVTEAADGNVTWSSDDVTAATWGSLRVAAPTVSPGAATVHDAGTSGVDLGYSVLVGGDQLRVISYDDTLAARAETPDGCWVRHLGLESRDLLGPPSAASLYPAAVGAAMQPANGGVSNEAYLYLKFPPAGVYRVCYRPAGGFWRPLVRVLVTAAVSGDRVGGPYNVTWALNDTRAGTLGVVAVSGEPMHTQAYSYTDGNSVAVLVSTAVAGCQPAHDSFAAGFSPLALSADVGAAEALPDEALTPGRFHSSAVLRDTVHAYVVLPAAGSAYVVCFRKGARNWQVISEGAAGSGLLTVTAAPDIAYELLDTRVGSFGRFFVFSGSGGEVFSSLDTLKLVSNATGGDGASVAACDRSSNRTGVAAGTVAPHVLAHCATSALSADVASPCRSDMVHEGIAYDAAAPPGRGLPNVFHFLTLSAPPLASGFSVCYQQYWQNWVLLPPSFFSADAAGISLVKETALATQLRGGSYHTFVLKATAGGSPLLFDLGAGRDAAKLVLLGQHCEYPPVRSAHTSDLHHPTDSSKNESAFQTDAAASLQLPAYPATIRATLCVRQHRGGSTDAASSVADSGRRNNWVALPDVITITPSGVSYSVATGVVDGGITLFRFLSPQAALDTRAQHDAFKLINSSQGCRGEESYARSDAAAAFDVWGVRDLGPGDAHTQSTSEVATVLPSAPGGEYRVCYYVASWAVWLEMGEETNADVVASVGLSPGTLAANAATGLLQPLPVGIVGVDVGAMLFAADGRQWHGGHALLGGVETAAARNTAVQFRILGDGFTAGDRFKMVKTKRYSTVGGWEATGADCTGTAEQGTETSTFVLSVGAAAPVFTLPIAAGKYIACYRWQGAGAAAWLRVPVGNISTTEPFNLNVAVDDELPVSGSEVYWRQPAGAFALVVEDHFAQGTTARPSLMTGTSAETSDWLRIVPASVPCQDTATPTYGASDIRLYMQPASGTAVANLAEVKPRFTADVSVPPTGSEPYKVCYRKLSSVSTGSVAVRMRCCVWTVLPSASGALYVDTATPAALQWQVANAAANPAFNATVGTPFLVSVRVVGASGQRVAGRRYVRFLDGSGQNAGRATPLYSWQCSSFVDAGAHGWPTNNTVVSTNDAGVAAIRLSWGRACSGCVLGAQVLEAEGAVPAAAPSLLFNAAPPAASVLSCPTLNAATGYLAGASSTSPLLLTHKLVYSVEVLALTAGGARAFFSDGTNTTVTLAVVDGASLFTSIAASADGAPADSWLRSDGVPVFAVPQGAAGAAAFALALVGDAAKIQAAGGAAELVLEAAAAWQPAGAAPLRLRLHARSVAAAYLEVSAVLAEPAAPVPAAWRAKEWAAEAYRTAAAAVLPRNDTFAATGAHLVSGFAYTLAATPRDAAGRAAQASALLTEGAGVALSDASGVRTDAVLHRVYADPADGLVKFVVTVARGCAVAQPCTLALTAGAARGQVTTPVRAVGTKLRLDTGAPVLAGTVDDALGPFAFTAVDVHGDVDDWHTAEVWPLISGGNGERNEDGVAVTDGTRSGSEIVATMNSGTVSFSSLRLNAPCASTGCAVHFVSSTGLELYATPALNIADNTAGLSGAVQGTPTSVAAHAWFTVTLTVVDAAAQATAWMSDFVAVSRSAGAAPFVVEGGSVQRMTRSVLTLRAQFTHPCTACALRFSVQPRAGVAWTLGETTRTWVMPTLAVTNDSVAVAVAQATAPTRADGTALSAVTGTAADLAAANPSGLPWYEVAKGSTAVFRLEAQDVNGARALSVAQAHNVTVSVAKRVGDSALDGDGGGATADPSTAAPMVRGVAVVRVTFVTPCLQCTVRFESPSGLSALEVLVTVPPVPTRVRLLPASAAPPETLQALGGQASNDAGVWANLSFALADGDALVYSGVSEAARAVLLGATMPGVPADAQPLLRCSSGCAASDTPLVPHPLRFPASIAEQVRLRLAGTVTPAAHFTVAGLEPQREGWFRASGGAGGVAAWQSAVKTVWPAEPPAPADSYVLRVLDVTAPQPTWLGYAQEASSKGYLTKAAFPAYNYTRHGASPGAAFPITAQVLRVGGLRAAGAVGRITVAVVRSSGCGSGLPVTQEGGHVVNGNATVWVTFGSSCEACVLEVVYDACAGQASGACTQGMLFSERRKVLAPLAVRPPRYTNVVVDVDADATVLPGSVRVGQLLQVTLRAVAYRDGTPVLATDASPDVVLLNAIMGAGAASALTFGEADPARAFWGNGGRLTDAAGRPQAKGVRAAFVGGVAVVRFGFERRCTGCAVEVACPDLGTSFLLRASSNADATDDQRFVVSTTGTQRAVAGLRRAPPELVRRAVPFSIGVWSVDAFGDRDFTAAAPDAAPSEVRRTNLGGNGDGGVLSHTNGGLSLRESGWARGVVVWRLQFSKSCFDCAVSFDGAALRMPVYTQATGLRVTSFEPASGVLPFNVTRSRLGLHQLSVAKVLLLAADDDGNRDYLYNADVQLGLSSSPFELLPPELAAFGDGGTPVFSGNQGHIRVTGGVSGAEAFSVRFTAPAHMAYVFFHSTYPPLSSAQNAARGFPAPPRLTLAAQAETLRVASHSGEVAYEGVPYSVYIAATTIAEGWMSSLVSGDLTVRFDAECRASASNITVVGLGRANVIPTQGVVVPASATGEVAARLSDGWVHLLLHFREARVSFQGIWCNVSFSVPRVLASSAELRAREVWQRVRIERVLPRYVGWAAATPPAHAAVGQPMRIPMVVFGAGGRRSLGAVGQWVRAGMDKCSGGGTATSERQVINAEGTVVLEVAFSHPGKCVLNVTTQSLGLGVGEASVMQFAVDVRAPFDIQFRSNITSLETPVLHTATPYALTVEVIDNNGTVVRGDYATQLHVEITQGPTGALVANTEHPAASRSELASAQSYHTRTAPVTVVNGSYTFHLLFSKPTAGGTPMSFIVVADWASGSAVAPPAGATASPAAPATLAPAVLLSEAIEVEAVPQASLFSPTPPSYYLSDTPLLLHGRLADHLGNAPTGMTNIERDMLLMVEGVTTGFGSYDVLSEENLLTRDVTVEFAMRWTGGDGDVDLSFLASSLARVPSRVFFQRPAALLLTALEVKVIPTNHALPVGVQVVDAAGRTVLGDFDTVVEASVSSGNGVLRQGVVMTKTVINGKTGFELVFVEAATNVYASFLARGFNLTYGPFTVVSTGNTPKPPSLVVYSPPSARVRLATYATPADFDAAAFSQAVSAAAAVSASNVNVLWVCPLDASGVAVSQASVGAGCRLLGSTVRRLVGPAAGAGQDRTAAALQGSGGGVSVDFQVVLRPDQGLAGDYYAADAASKAVLSTVGAALASGSGALADLAGAEYAAAGLSVTDLQGPPTEVPPVAPATLAPRVTPRPSRPTASPTDAPTDAPQVEAAGLPMGAPSVLLVAAAAAAFLVAVLAV